MIQTHPPFEQRISANQYMLSQTPQNTGDGEPRGCFNLRTLDHSSGDFGVQDMLAAKARHGMAAEVNRS